jgi:hypothetical protein
MADVRRLMTEAERLTVRYPMRFLKCDTLADTPAGH